MRSVRRKVVASAFAAVFAVAMGLSTGAGAQAQELPAVSISGRFSLNRDSSRAAAVRMPSPQHVYMRPSPRTAFMGHRSSTPTTATGKWSYSGEGFFYLQKTVESLTGTPFATLAEQRVFDRFGMASSDLLSDPAFDAVSAVGHRSDGTAVPLRTFAKANIAYTLRTTATDYSKFLRGALLGGEGLAPATRDAMFTPSGSADHGGTDRRAIDHIKWGLRSTISPASSSDRAPCMPRIG